MALTPNVPAPIRRATRRKKPNVGPASKQPTPPADRASKVDASRRDRDPNYRSKLPASALTPAQRRTRALNARIEAHNQDPLLDPAQQLSGSHLLGAARTLADLEIDPQVKALNRELGSATTQGTALAGHAGDYYGRLAQADQTGIQRQQALAAMLSAGVKGVADRSANALQGIGQAEVNQAIRDADVRGSLGATDQVQAEAAHDRALNEAVMGQAQASAQEQGANWIGLAGTAAMARSARGGEVQGELLNRLANTQGDIRGKITDKESERGGLVTKNLLGLRQSGFENAATQAGLNLDADKIRAAIENNIRTTTTSAQNNRRTTTTSAANNRRTTSTSAANNQRTTAQSDINNQRTTSTSRQNVLDRIAAAGGRKGNKGAGWATNVQQRDFRREVGSGSAVATALKKKGRTRKQVTDALQAPSKQFPKGMDNVTASVVADAVYSGHISRRNVDRLHKAGIRIDQLGIPTTDQIRRRTRRRYGGIGA